MVRLIRPFCETRPLLPRLPQLLLRLFVLPEPVEEDLPIFVLLLSDIRADAGNNLQLEDVLAEEVEEAIQLQGFLLLTEELV